jgi:hypothetical protein
MVPSILSLIKSNERLKLLWKNMRCLEIGLPLLHKKIGKRQQDEGVIPYDATELS